MFVLVWKKVAKLRAYIEGNELVGTGCACDRRQSFLVW